MDSSYSGILALAMYDNNRKIQRIYNMKGRYPWVWHRKIHCIWLWGVASFWLVAFGSIEGETGRVQYTGRCLYLEGDKSKMSMTPSWININGQGSQLIRIKFFRQSPTILWHYSESTVMSGYCGFEQPIMRDKSFTMLNCLVSQKCPDPDMKTWDQILHMMSWFLQSVCMQASG